MDNRLGYLLMNEMAECIRADKVLFKPLQISLYINGKCVTNGKASEVFKYLSENYATFLWFDKEVSEYSWGFQNVLWNISMEK